MIEHIVLFRWVEGASEEAINQVMRGLCELKALVPDIVDLAAGTNFCDRSEGYTHALVVRFTDKSALEVYATHPAHLRVIREHIEPIKAQVLALDFEF